MERKRFCEVTKMAGWMQHNRQIYDAALLVACGGLYTVRYTVMYTVVYTPSTVLRVFRAFFTNGYERKI